MRITIDREFKSLIPPLTAEEFDGLEQSILSEKRCRDPLVLWKHGNKHILLDGHTRYSIICSSKGIKHRTVVLPSIRNRKQARNWIIDNSLSRRNLTPEARDYLLGKRYKNEKGRVGRPKKLEQNVPISTSEEIGKEFGLTGMTIKRAEKFADAIDTVVSTFPTRRQKEVKTKLLSRKTHLSKKDVLEISAMKPENIRDVVDNSKDLWEVKYELSKSRSKKRKKTARMVSLKEVQLYHCDCIKELRNLDENSCDSCVVDPPFGIGKGHDNFSVHSIARKTANHTNVDHKKQSGRSASMQAGLYDMTLKGARKYQVWCYSWAVEVLRVVKPGGYLLACCSTRMYHRLACAVEEAGWEVRDTISWNFGTGFPKSKKFSDGWGTNLKPAMELICLARKPLSELTLQKNIKKWGTGALNIDACRIGSESRWPANAIFDEQAAKFLDTQANKEVSRFFYCPKASERERDFGLEYNEDIHTTDGRNNNRCSFCGKKPTGPKHQRCRCSEVLHEGSSQSRNNHPCVKPVSLFSYLIRLVTPHCGTVLDCFMGSGSSGVAAGLMGGLRYIGMEKEKEYFDIGRDRILSAYRQSVQSYNKKGVK